LKLREKQLYCLAVRTVHTAIESLASAADVTRSLSSLVQLTSGNGQTVSNAEFLFSETLESGLLQFSKLEQRWLRKKINFFRKRSSVWFDTSQRIVSDWFSSISFHF